MHGIHSCVSTVDLGYVAELASAQLLESHICATHVHGNIHIVSTQPQVRVSYFHEAHMQDLLMRSRKLPRDVNSNSVVMPDVLWNVREPRTPITHSDQIVAQIAQHVSQGELSHAASQLIAYVYDDPDSSKLRHKTVVSVANNRQSGTYVPLTMKGVKARHHG